MKWIQRGANLRAFSLSRRRALHFLIPVKEALIHLAMRILLLAEYAHDLVCKRLNEKGRRRTLFWFDENLDGHSRLRFILAVALVLQFAQRKYVPAAYWLSVVLISIVGTLITDNLVDNFHVPLMATTIAFSIALDLAHKGSAKRLSRLPLRREERPSTTYLLKPRGNLLRWRGRYSIAKISQGLSLQPLSPA